MSSQRRRKLDAVVAQLQLDYGPRAIRRAGPDEHAEVVGRIPTTFAELDRALGGGLPQGRLTEISGPATSGKLTLAAKAISAAHRADGDALAAWVDLSRTCDPDYLDRCGIALDRLLVVRPASLADALAVTLHLVRSNALAVLVFDRFGANANQVRAAVAEEDGMLARLPQLLSGTATAAVFLSDPREPSSALAHAAAVRISISRERWIMRDADVRGYQSRAEIVKNRHGHAGARVAVHIIFNGTVRGDGL